ncbi:MAG: carboxypeptidase regulatory-like domain-containing protein, partial [Candidatus Hydrogenedentes bacterium]|nr:carboxypeptidase regulatory-like domain-containing protein [Candidatus Hydrogenedentota bacterium]
MTYLKKNSRGISRSLHVTVLLASLMVTTALIGFPARVVTADDGDLVWAVSAGGTLTDRGASIAALPDGSALVTGSFGRVPFPPGFTYTATFGTGDDAVTLTSAGQDLFLAKYNPDATLAWVKQASGDTSDEPVAGYGIAAGPDGGALVTGEFIGLEEPASVIFGPGEDNETHLLSVGGYDVFVAKFEPPPTYSISGTVSLDGGTALVTDVTLALTGDDSQTTNPASDGTYSFTGLLEGTYTVTPSLVGYAFEPTQRDYEPLNSDQANQDFVGTHVPPPTYSISGTVTLVGGTASATDVTLELSGDASELMNPDEDGTYASTDLLAGNYIVIPSLDGYTFEPGIRTYAPLDSDQIDQDFTGYPVGPERGGPRGGAGGPG